jgi:hypothetical protein
MYEASPESDVSLDVEKTKEFISTIDFNKINAMGFYGGELSCDYENYQKFIDLIPKEVIKFTITNGTWSTKDMNCKEFIDFVGKNNLQAFISATKFHKPFQNLESLTKISLEHNFTLNEECYIIPMGRSKKSEWDCSKKCLSYNVPMKLTLNPYGDVIFCNCDGVYPVVGTYNNDFDTVVKNGLNIKNFCYKLKNKVR